MIPNQRPKCSRIILTKELGDAMQKRYELLYQTIIINNANRDSQKCEINNLKNLLTEIQNRDPRIDGFRIHLGLDNNGLLFLFKGLIKLEGSGAYYQINSSGNNYTIVDEGSAKSYTDNYDLRIRKLPEIDHGLKEGNTTAYVYKGLLNEFVSVLKQQDSNSPIKEIKIKLSVCIKNPPHHNYIDRIVIGFSFMDGANEIHLTDVTGQYGCDMPVRLDGLGADTGSPCPPKTNCPT